MKMLFHMLGVLSVALLVVPLPADEPGSADEPLDVDGLFDTEQETEQEDEADDPSQDEAQDETVTVLDRLQEQDPVDLGANTRLVFGYSPGWSASLGTEGSYEDLVLLNLTSAIDLTLRISKVLEVTQAFSFAYPSYEFRVTKLALDYAIQDAVFLKLGRTRLNWGRSPNFAYTNLLHRQAENPLSEPAPDRTLVGRVSVPIGIGGVEAVIQSKAEYHEDPSSPSPDSFGYGMKFNLARERVDLDVGAYYQRGLSGRAFVSGTTTVFDWLELYGEALVADERVRLDPTGPYAGEEEPTTASGDPIEDGEVEIAPDMVIPTNNPDYAAGLGMVIGLFDNNLDLNAEYLYNGEETEAIADGAPFPLFWGHNFAANADWSFPDTPLRLRIAYRYSHTFGSSMLLPRLTIDAFRHTTVDVGGGMLWGAPDSGYRANNPDTADRSTFFAVTVTLNGKL